MLKMRLNKYNSNQIELYTKRRHTTEIWAVFDAFYHSDNTNKIKIILNELNANIVDVFIDTIRGRKVFSEFSVRALPEMGLTPDDIDGAPFLLIAGFTHSKHFIDRIIENKIND